MFKFDFKVEEEEETPFRKENKAEGTDINVNNVSDDMHMEWYGSEEIVPKREILENLDIYALNSTTTAYGNITLDYLISGFLLQDITTANEESGSLDIKKAEESHSDLIPGVYEGGAKIWECTEDLLKYVASTLSASEEWHGKRVLDLGCGSGLLGIYAYKAAANVEFQDYNKDVLENITIPNVLLNVPKPPNTADLDLQKLREDVRFYSGDWSKYADLTKDEEKFDVILTSETIYNPLNQQKLLDTFARKLKPEGFVLVAAKIYYFGVGGGLRQFEELIKQDKRFKSEVVWSATEGLSRQILKLEFL